MALDAGVSVVLPTFNRLAILRDVVAALLADDAASEVIVVDDGSTDGTLDWLEGSAAADRRLRVVRLGGKGPAHARQAGLDAARFDKVLFLDDDVVPTPGLVAGHARHLAADERIVVVGYTPSVLPPARTPGDTAEVAYSRDYEKHTRRWESGEPVLDGLWGGNFSLWAEAGRRVGVVSDRYQERHAVHEDRDFGLRCAEAGMHGVFDRALRGDHYYRRSARRAALDSTRRSGGTIRLHAVHPEIGPFDEAEYTSGIPGPALPLLRVLRRKPVGGPLLEVLIRAVDMLSRIGLAGAADPLFKVMRRFAEHVGIERERSAPGLAE